MDSIILNAPAKVNLFLDVLGKRNDGYHNILTVFERINLCDRISISKSPRPGIALYCDIKIPKDDNLAFKAARLILSKNKIKRGIVIKIKKNIPVASGLGGGSSDAASTLIGINELFNLKLGKDELMNMGGAIGADVPFFILDKSFAIGMGRGDKLKPLGFSPPRMWHLLVSTGVRKLTRDVYRALKLSLTRRPCNVKMLLHALKIGDLELIKRATYNRLEDPALNRDRRLSALKTNLVRLGMGGALLSGSGPTIFGITKARKEAVLLREKILKTLGVKAEGWQVFIARTF